MSNTNVSLQKVSVLNKIRSILGRLMQYAELPIRLAVKFFGFLFLFRMVSGAEMFASIEQTGLFHSQTVQMVLAVMATLLPNRCGVFIAMALITYNVFQASLLGAVLVGLVLMLLYVIASSLFPDEVFLMVLVPACIQFNWLLAVPLVAGMYMGAVAVIPVVIGVLFYGFYNIIPLFMGLQMDGSLDGIPKLISEASKNGVNQLMSNDALVYMMVVFAAIILLTALIRMLHVNFSRYIALGAGSIFGIASLMVGASKGNIADASLLANSLITIAVLLILELLSVPLSYKSAQILEFEDDAYLYKVRMIPKMGDTHMIPGGKTRITSVAEKKAARHQKNAAPLPMAPSAPATPAPMPGANVFAPVQEETMAAPTIAAPGGMQSVQDPYAQAIDLTLAPNEVHTYSGDFSEFGMQSPTMAIPESGDMEGTMVAGETRMIESPAGNDYIAKTQTPSPLADEEDPTDLFSEYGHKL